MATAAAAAYSKVPNIRLYLDCDEQMRSHLIYHLKALQYLIPASMEAYDLTTKYHHIVVHVANFEKPRMVQRMARRCSQEYSPLAYKIVYISAPEKIAESHMLLAREVGARFVAFGGKADRMLLDHMKTATFTSEDSAYLRGLEEDIQRCRREQNLRGFKEVQVKLRELNAKDEEVLRLYVQLNQALRRPKKIEWYLRHILELNPQNLWAANELGKHYIEYDRVAEGTEILEKMSRYHDLNAERKLTLGEAYLNSGQSEKAGKAFSKGEELTEGDDGRFKDGLSKVKLAEGDMDGALQLLGKEELSLEALAFLNMRAIMCMKTGKKKEGFRLYEMAAGGASRDPVVAAKINFNMGLAYARDNDVAKAKQRFAQSVKLGGKKFTKGQKPLTIVDKVLKNRRSPAEQPDIDQELEDIEAALENELIFEDEDL